MQDGILYMMDSADGKTRLWKMNDGEWFISLASLAEQMENCSVATSENGSFKANIEAYKRMFGPKSWMNN
jgi:hypothetical protein